MGQFWCAWAAREKGNREGAKDAKKTGNQDWCRSERRFLVSLRVLRAFAVI
jgi:ribosomal protein L19E